MNRHGRAARHPKHPARPGGIRQRICAEAARIMAAEGMRDFQTAKRKAAARLNHPETRDWPSNREIEEALRAYLDLFHGDQRLETLGQLRRIALEAMHALADHEPRLVGAVLSGTVTPYSPIELHVVADQSEDIALLLEERGIPHDQRERPMRFGGDRQRAVPTFSFRAGGTLVNICVFSPEAMREPPLSPVDGRPMERAGLAAVQRLVG